MIVTFQDSFMRSFLLWGGVLLLQSHQRPASAAEAAEAPLRLAKPARPDVLFILVDDMGYNPGPQDVLGSKNRFPAPRGLREAPIIFIPI